jgi:hypothetical protein
VTSDAAELSAKSGRAARLPIRRSDFAAHTFPSFDRRVLAKLAILALAVGFVVVGVDDLDLGPADARLGLAAREHIGPMGQVFGYWAPDLWPAQVWPSKLVSLFQPAGESSSNAVRWPSAIAGILVGWIIIAGMARNQGKRAAIFLGFCWFGSIGLIDRSATTGADLILALGVVGAIERIMARGADWIAGLWAAWAFLAGGWPPLALIIMACIVLAKTSGGMSGRLLVSSLVAAAAWSVWAIATSSTEAWAAALTLPFTEKPSWMLAVGALALGMPWSPFCGMAASAHIRSAWNPKCRAWVIGWAQIAIVALIAGTLIPGMMAPARMAALAGLAIGAAASLDSVWSGTLSRRAGWAYFVLFGTIIVLWLAAALYATFIWCVAMPFYRVPGVTVGLLTIVIAGLAWSALATGNSRRAVVALVLVTVGLKLAHWLYYVPEWNYRRSQGPWARAIAQWVPRRWTVYTIHDWPADLAFYMKRPVRQLRSPRFLEYQPGPESKFVLLLPSERENWPESAIPIETVARFHDQYGGERVLARTPGEVPPPLGPYPFHINHDPAAAGQPRQAHTERLMPLR